MLDLEPYLVEFDSKRKIKDKVNPDNCQVRSLSCKTLILIKYDEYIFFTNDKITHK